jgi:LPXTG-motif cell wall-anchored protein
MVARAGEGYILFGKKLYGLLLIILGCLLTATGISSNYPGFTALGILSLLAGAILLVLKIVRRNEGGQIK